MGELSSIRRGASPRPIQDPKWFDNNSDIGWLRISDVTEQNGKIFNLEQKLSEKGQEKTLVLHTPHLILSIAATVGKPVINYVPIGVHDGFIAFLNLNTDINFLFQWLEYFQNKWQALGQSGSQVNINSELVRKQKISIPRFKEEQTQIGNFFKQLDETIALHKRKLAKLFILKSAFLTSIFCTRNIQIHTQNPISWEQRKLGDIAKITIGEFVIQTKQDDSYPYPVFNGGSSNTGFYNEFNNEGNKILISARGANAGFINIIKTRYWAGNSCYSIDLLNKNLFDIDYVYYEMKRTQSKFTDYKQSANIPSVSKNNVENLVIKVPNINEQTQIGNLFKQLDETIALHKRKQRKYQQIKQVFLSKMFTFNNYTKY
ncbi:type I restriction modification DNA specificity domain-containing protein [Canicola haemoglobinophilus]|uniref:Type I restriction modification DNA specificity domain-containing protein n=2 Tax=Canicola haemoglobinophilus TaxID=733 RepID=A0A377HRA0_9PAST|nr:type I restriction modification DNA specificity domain-containing protein [Canicola haemoglobinophilus]